MRSPADPSGDAPRIAVIADDLLAVRVGDAVMAQAVAAELRHEGAWREVVAGLDSVVVQFDNLRLDVETAVRSLAAATAAAPAAGVLPDELIEIPVRYGDSRGPDLDAVCAALGIDQSEFIARHTGREHRVEMLGFTPGFAYVGGLDAALDLPRLRQPRQRVAAGSVGVAGRYTGLYALPGPGGWSVVGRTPLQLFDADAGRPFLLSPGQRVRFRAIGDDEFERLATR